MSSSAHALLERLPERFAHAWNQRDVDALFGSYADDADFIDMRGALLHGRDAMISRHREWFETTLAHSSLGITTVKVRLISRRVAVVHGVWHMRGHAAGAYLPVRTGIISMVAVRRDGAWTIVSAQNTDLPGTH